eukprot:TRINITY_DN4174_c0_g1_i1.p1 TRINITY_DN4174_c0_g1~~TRINITY_DN4174_c0_g1_i1.p1  ORF type:complete len:165 (+),score=29.27 TRINITY_DN4174_c0_g1_i1:100-594(+)
MGKMIDPSSIEQNPTYIRDPRSWVIIRRVLYILMINQLLNTLYLGFQSRKLFDDSNNEEALNLAKEAGQSFFQGVMFFFMARSMSLCACYASALYSLIRIISAVDSIGFLIQNQVLLDNSHVTLLVFLSLAYSCLTLYVAFLAYKEIKYFIQKLYTAQCELISA